MIRKHNRRAAKAAFAIAFGVAIVLGGAAAAPAAVDRSEATPIIIGTKNFPEQYVLGQLYKQALEAKGFKVQYKENIGSTELIDASLRSGRVTLYPEYTGIMLSVPSSGRRCRRRRSAPTGRLRRCTRSGVRRCSGRHRSRTTTGSRCSARPRPSMG